MPNIPRVLVVGTTTDYIDWIRCRCPERALFLTDPLMRYGSGQPNPAPHEEILCHLSDYDLAREKLKNHLRMWGLSIDGITSYDCESMELTAFLAQEFSLNYSSLESVCNCRDKFLSKTLWRQWDLECPRIRRLESSKDAVEFLNDINAPCVLKPVSGSGSELVFYCENENDCERCYDEIFVGLTRQRENRLYRFSGGNGPLIIAEEFVAGKEFSCDFFLENGRTEVIRITRKIEDQQGPFGTTLGYILPASLPSGIDPTAFQRTLCQSARALGLKRALCMADFLIKDNTIMLLEMAPRPGGDCLPFLMRQRFRQDMLKLNLDFAQLVPIRLPHLDGLDPYIGLCLRAKSGGVLRKIDISPLRQDPRIRDIDLRRTPGHVIRMPPADYNSWLLGHIVFEPWKGRNLERQCVEVLDKVIIEVD